MPVRVHDAVVRIPRRVDRMSRRRSIPARLANALRGVSGRSPTRGPRDLGHPRVVLPVERRPYRFTARIWHHV